jgi:hypothetical protein
MAAASKRSTNAPRAAIAVAAVLVVLICIEGSGFRISPASGGVLAGPVNPRTPIEPPGQAGIAAPQLHLPIYIAANRRYVLWSTNGFPKIVNGRASVDPSSFTELTNDVRGFPDAGSVARLRALGVRSVILHPYLLTGTSWRDAATKSIDGLGVTRTRRGDVVVVDLDPPKAK